MIFSNVHKLVSTNVEVAVGGSHSISRWDDLVFPSQWSIICYRCLHTLECILLYLVTFMYSHTGVSNG